MGQVSGNNDLVNKQDGDSTAILLGVTKCGIICVIRCKRAMDTDDKTPGRVRRQDWRLDHADARNRDRSPAGEVVSFYAQTR